MRSAIPQNIWEKVPSNYWHEEHDLPRGFCRWCGNSLGPGDAWFYWLHRYHRTCKMVRDDWKQNPPEKRAVRSREERILQSEMLGGLATSQMLLGDPAWRDTMQKARQAYPADDERFEAAG